MFTYINGSVKWNKVMLWQSRAFFSFLGESRFENSFMNAPLLIRETYWVREWMSVVSSILLYHFPEWLPEWNRMYVVWKRDLQKFGQLQHYVCEGVCANCSTALLAVSFPFLFFFSFLSFHYPISFLAV